MKIIVTGGLGFIGSAFVRLLSEQSNCKVIVIDKMTYAADQSRLEGYGYDLVTGDICDKNIEWVCRDADYIVNFVAETHVDNSIVNGNPFIKTNIEGTYNLIEIARKIPTLKKFIQISTDEVYGDVLYGTSKDTDNLNPSSYYSASKAAADMLVMSAGRTYGLPYLITRTCNNYGKNQHQEKLLPTIINCIKNDIPIPVYGDGLNIREWIHADDNSKAIFDFMISDTIGVKNIGSGERYTNLEIIGIIEKILNKPVKFNFVEDRKGHDRIYALVSNYEGSLDYTLKKYLKECLES